MKKNNLKLLLVLFLINLKPLLGQTNYSYTFQVVNPTSCGGCCTNTICMTNVTGGCGPIQFAWMTPTSGTFVSGSANSCTLNLCDGTYTAVVIDPTGMCPITTCSIVTYYPIPTTIKVNSYLSKEINLFPNPANEAISIHITTSLNMTEKLKIKMYNSLGQMIKEEVLRLAQQPDSSYIAEINTKDLENGVYVLSLLDGSTSLTTGTPPSSATRSDRILVSKRFVVAR